MNPRIAASRPLTILLVDDDPKVLSLGGELLEALGYQVLVAGDGEQALNLYQTPNLAIDLIILDYQLPRGDGYQILQQLSQLNPQVKVIISSGFFGGADLKKLREAGATRFIQKPFRIKELEEQIKKALG